MSEKSLKPCPFCGSPAMLEELGDHHGAYYNLGCSVRSCLAHHAIYTESPDECSIEDSIAAWNRRPALEAQLSSEPVAIASRGDVAFFVKWTEAGDYLRGQSAIPLFAAPPVSSKDAEDAARYRAIKTRHSYLLIVRLVGKDGGYASHKAGDQIDAWADAAVAEVNAWDALTPEERHRSLEQQIADKQAAMSGAQEGSKS